MIRALVEAAFERSHRYQDKKFPDVRVQKINSYDWLVSVVRTDADGSEVVVCKAHESSYTRALLACGFALLVAQKRTSRLNEAILMTRSLASAVAKALK